MLSPTVLGLSGLLLLVYLFHRLSYKGGSRTTRLRGPPSNDLIFGLSQSGLKTTDASDVYEQWAAEYGAVFQVPIGLGRRKIVLTDPKALLHFYSSERSVYVKTRSSRVFIAEIFGRGLLWAEGDVHRRQRKALTPAFSNAAIRRLTSVFFDSTYKLKTLWDNVIESQSQNEAIIDVQGWMNRVALDSIGIAGFSHDFHYLDGHESAVTVAFESLQATEPGSLAGDAALIIANTFPFVLSLPTQRMQMFRALGRSLDVIADRLLQSTRREKGGNMTEDMTDKSVIGLLLKAEIADAELYMTKEEVVAQMNVLLLAGYETTSVSLTWALIELARNPTIQSRLRDELLSRFSSSDPTWDQLISQLPYLDAVVSEVLRTHPPVTETPREAGVDDVIPLGTPVVTPSGEVISSVSVAQGEIVLVPIRCINRSQALWGPDAASFRPERWFDEIPEKAGELQGYRHILTFHDGPRVCLGKSFALAEFKAALSVLVRNFEFELPDGPDTKIGTHMAVVPRPKVEGQDGAKVPLKVKRVDV